MGMSGVNTGKTDQNGLFGPIGHISHIGHIGHIGHLSQIDRGGNISIWVHRAIRRHWSI